MIGKSELFKTQFKHFISLGYFCSVALELERFGLRNASYPFDWNIVEFTGVIAAINNNFENYFDANFLEQSKKYHNYYRNRQYGVQFYHDFNKYDSLYSQLPAVKNKYKRRIERFYNDIKEPTLFIRYISDEKRNNDGKSIELLWIEQNYEMIFKSLTKYNPNNQIMFWGNNELDSEKIKIYHVQKDKNDVVARKPADKNYDIYNLLNSYNFPNKEHNISIYKQKQRGRIKSKILSKLSFLNLFKQKEYCHDKQY